MCDADPKLPRVLVGRPEMDPEQDASIDNFLGSLRKTVEEALGVGGLERDAPHGELYVVGFEVLSQQAREGPG